MKMIVGLGNIGPQYHGTRHNTGFIVVEEFAKEHGIKLDTRKMEAHYGTGMVEGEKVMVVEPTTFMNESGRAVHPLMEYFNVDIDDLIIVYDDMDLPVGRVRLRDKGSAGGHNGIKSLISHLSTKEFNRIKVGTGRPKNHQSVVDYVLSKFSPDDIPDFQAASQQAVHALNNWVGGMSMTELENKYN
ncbi:aminoacyl-tRNA hydrolase [Levilactobacillus bambusae]|uniref:Peptidyl-tRNA hydrolase n=1 Tax=Levilactobacillus bambusae TaxID=2024736 RepID=A0A2V1MWN0_9LACO|nr:aminoacyl-tRNA hydrolase [Levilactobacillus bambusae]PWF99301.1 aminoacyl-tRNA hydrolase [Levilactobacillus bambusae]